jgi:hypothetical protein
MVVAGVPDRNKRRKLIWPSLLIVDVKANLFRCDLKDPAKIFGSKKGHEKAAEMFEMEVFVNEGWQISGRVCKKISR